MRPRRPRAPPRRTTAWRSSPTTCRACRGRPPAPPRPGARCAPCCRSASSSWGARSRSRPRPSGRARASARSASRCRRSRCATPRRPVPRSVAWRDAQRKAKRKPAALALGTPAFTTARRAKGVSDVSIAFRSGAGLAILRYRTPAALADARATARQLATLELARLRTALGRTVFDRVSDGIRADGTIPPATLRQLTALLYGGVQGVKLPKGIVGRPTIDGTAVLEALGASWSSFSTAQKRALERALDRGPTPRKKPKVTSDTPRLPSANTCKASADGAPLMPALTADALVLRDAIAARIPGYGTPAWTVCVYDWGTDNGTSLADTIQWRTSADSTPWNQDMWDTIAFFAGTLDMCFVRVFPDWFTISAANQRTLMGHEMYHCLHKEWGKGSTSEKSPAWAEESLATWAGHQVAPATYAPPDKAPGSFYRYWNEHWAKKLFTRTYDGLGFIGRVEQVSGASGVWDRVKSVWTAKEDSPAAFANLTGSNQPDVLNTWGSGLYRQPSFPAGWHQTVPWDVPDTYAPEYFKMTIPLGAATERLETKDYRPDMYVVRSDERPLVNVTVEGFGRVTDGKTDWPQPARAVVLLRRQVRVPRGPAREGAHPAPRRHRRQALRGARGGRRRLGAGARAARDVRVLRGRRGAAAAAHRNGWGRAGRRLQRRPAPDHERRRPLRLPGRRRVRAGARPRVRGAGAPGAVGDVEVRLHQHAARASASARRA